MGVMVNSSHCFCHCFLLRERNPSPAPAWGPLLGRQSSTKLFNMSHSHVLQLFTNCSSMVPFLHESAVPAESLLQCALPTRSQPSFRHPSALAWGSSKGCRWVSAPPWIYGEKEAHGGLLLLSTTAWKEVAARWGLGSSPRQLATGQEEMASSCSRAGSGWTSGSIFSLKGWLSIGMGCPGKWWESPSLEVFNFQGWWNDWT